MTCKIEKSQLNGEVVCPPSKSYTHRAVFLAALSDGKSIVKDALYSSDTRATIDACKTFGVATTTASGLSLSNSILVFLYSGTLNFFANSLPVFFISTIE